MKMYTEKIFQFLSMSISQCDSMYWSKVCSQESRYFCSFLSDLSDLYVRFELSENENLACKKSVQIWWICKFIQLTVMQVETNHRVCVARWISGRILKLFAVLWPVSLELSQSLDWNTLYISVLSNISSEVIFCWQNFNSLHENLTWAVLEIWSNWSLALGPNFATCTGSICLVSSAGSDFSDFIDTEFVSWIHQWSVVCCPKYWIIEYPRASKTSLIFKCFSPSLGNQGKPFFRWKFWSSSQCHCQKMAQIVVCSLQSPLGKESSLQNLGKILKLSASSCSLWTWSLEQELHSFLY